MTRLKEIGENFPTYVNQINEINKRILDLMDPFSKKHYYNPEMRGSYSIKNVLPALVPDLSYKEMNINEGGAASLAFESLYTETDDNKINKIRTDLLAYCGLDTLAMVEILNVLTRALSSKYQGVIHLNYQARKALIILNSSNLFIGLLIFAANPACFAFS